MASNPRDRRVTSDVELAPRSSTVSVPNPLGRGGSVGGAAALSGNGDDIAPLPVRSTHRSNKRGILIAASVLVLVAAMCGAFFAGHTLGGEADAIVATTTAPTGQRMLKQGTTCGTHEQCRGLSSYCLNFAPHTPPFVCEADSTPACHASTQPECAHGGNAYELTCENDDECPGSAVCAMGENVQDNRPRMCVPSHGTQPHEGYLCACACVSLWGGETCEEWDPEGEFDGPADDDAENTDDQVPPGGRRDTEVARLTAAKATKIQSYSRLVQTAAGPPTTNFLEPFTGGLGHGFHEKKNSITVPMLGLTYDNANKEYEGHRLPNEANVDTSSHFLEKFAALWTYDEVANAAAQEQALLDSSQYYMYLDGEGIFSVANLPSTFNTYFKGDDAVAVSQLMWYAYTATFKEGVPSQSLGRYAELALSSLPTGSAANTASGKAAYDQFVDTYGTHMIVGGQNGGAVGLKSRYPFQLLYAAEAGGVSTSAALTTYAEQILKEDFTRTIKLKSDGTAASASEVSAATEALKEVPVYQPQHDTYCFGGDPTKCNPGQYEHWAESVKAAPVPVYLQLLPISHVASAKGSKDFSGCAQGLTAAANRVRTAINHAAEAVNSCDISCGHGRHCTQNICQCGVNEIGRLCAHCRAGYGGSGSCAVAECSQGCNSAGGHCVAPNTCNCESCYSGSDCMTYTCGCLSAEGKATRMVGPNSTELVPLGDLRIGDTVLSADPATGETLFSDVYFMRLTKEGGAADPAAATVTRVSVVEDNGERRTVSLTGGHLLYKANGDAVTAEDVVRGDWVWMAASGRSSGLVPRRVVDVEVVASDAGLVTVATMAGPIVVDGVLVSSYEWSDVWGPLESLDDRLLYALAPSFAKSEAWQKHAQWWDVNVAEPYIDPCTRFLTDVWTACQSIVESAPEGYGVAGVGVAALVVSMSAVGLRRRRSH